MRLEKDGVFKSWAVPKGIPIEHGVRRLAMQVEDHDISFGTFEGEIPPGEYGVGTIKIWDHGFYAPTKWTDDLIEFSVDAKRETGEYALCRFRKRGENAWLLVKEQASSLKSGSTSLPREDAGTAD